MKISIIAPVYNVSEFILTFIESIYDQLSKEVEIIIVNDGCQDDSINKLKNFISKKKHDESKVIRIINQENKGLSAARNRGVEESQGSYISFVDTDDFVLENYVDVLIEKINNYDFDVLTFNANRVDLDGCFLSDWVICSESENREDCIYDIFNRGRWYAWARLFKREIILSNPFPINKRFEDFLTLPKVYMNSKKLLNINDVLLSYRVNPNGITKNISEKDIIDVKQFTNIVYDNYLSSELTPMKKFELLSTYLSGVKTLFYLTNDYYGPFKSIFKIKRYIVRNFFITNTTGLSAKNKIFLKFIFAYYFHYNLSRK